MSITTKSAITGLDKGQHWEKLTDQLFNDLRKTALKHTDIAERIHQGQNGMLMNMDAFFGAIIKAGSTAVTPSIARPALSAQTSHGKVEEGQSYNYIELGKMMTELKNLPTFDEKWEIDHRDITPTNTRLTAIIEVMERIKQGYIDLQSRGGGAYSDPANQKVRDMKVPAGNPQAQLKEIDNRLKQARVARVYLQQLEKSFLSGSVPTEQDLINIIGAAGRGTSYDITTDKINDVNVYESGGDLGSYQVIEKDDHDIKSVQQSRMGHVVSKILTGKYRLPPSKGNTFAAGSRQAEMAAIDALVEKIENVATGAGAIVGSEGIENSIERQLHEIFEGKKPKPSKSRTTKTKKIKQKEDLRRTKAAVAKLKAKKRRTKKALEASSATTARAAGQNRSSADQAKGALHLKRLINKKLPAEVRRNMGRPALINQTGRFSSSVQLESLVPSAAGMVGKYSYMYRPYETFENTGSKRWPTGYNPKPLITKSIRNLALQHMETKLTLRRT